MTDERTAAADEDRPPADPWHQRWRPSIAVAIAVAAALSAFKAGSAGSLAVVLQAQASDTWAHEQAKSLKQHLAEQEVSLLSLQRLTLPEGHPARAAFDERIRQQTAEAQRQLHEKQALEAQARELEARRDDAQRRGRILGWGVIGLQVGILLQALVTHAQWRRGHLLILSSAAAGLACLVWGLAG